LSKTKLGFPKVMQLYNPNKT